MRQELNHQQIARNLAKAIADKANEKKLRSCTKKQCFNNSSQWKKVNYLSFYGMDNQTHTLKF